MAIFKAALIPVNWSNAWPFAAFNLSKNFRRISLKSVGQCFELHIVPRKETFIGFQRVAHCMHSV